MFVDPEGKRETWVDEKNKIKKIRTTESLFFFSSFRSFTHYYHQLISYPSLNRDAHCVFEQNISFPPNLSFQKNVIVQIYMLH
jgi:hypothetical protein